jgi:Transposase DDE domain
MPRKHNADRRHHVAKMAFNARNQPQTEGLMASVITLMDLTISAPDHSTISRRAVTLPVSQPASLPHGPLHLSTDSAGLQVYGAGQWLEAKHGAKSRRKWRSLHLAVDADNGMISFAKSVPSTAHSASAAPRSRTIPSCFRTDRLAGAPAHSRASGQTATGKTSRCWHVSKNCD